MGWTVDSNREICGMTVVRSVDEARTKVYVEAEVKGGDVWKEAVLDGCSDETADQVENVLMRALFDDVMKEAKKT